MLIDNKFIYVSLPRCSSTAFYYSCLLQNIEVKRTNDSFQKNNSKVNFKDVPVEELMNHIEHGHERLNDIQNKFGYDYPIIGVKRNRYERFYSLFKHILFDLKRIGQVKIYDHLKKITAEELFFFKSSDIMTIKDRCEVINDYLLKNDLIERKTDISWMSRKNIENFDWKNFMDGYIINVFDILLTPTSYYHNHNKNIIWFDFNNLSELEMWVSDILEKKFILQKANSSSHVECNLKIDDKFISLYNDVFNLYDLPKNVVTII